MAIDFPASPTLNDTFTAGGVTYTWDGTAWVASGSAAFVQKSGDTMSGALAINADLTVDTDTLYVDSTNNRVGIGETSPGSTLHLTKTDATAYDATATDGQVGIGPTLYLENPANANNTVGGQIVFGMRSTEEQARIAATGGTTPSLTFGTADDERMRITSAGNAGIGTSSPEGRMHVRADGDETKALLNLQNRDTGSSAASQIAFFNGAVDLSDNRYAYIRCTKTGTNGNFLTFGTNSTGNPPGERIRILAEGGLTFNGDTAAANALDDYEEGTWTPVFEGATTAGSYTYSTQVGKYTKIGNKVTVTVTLLNITTVSAGSGTLNISGLPFAQAGDYSVGAMYMAHFDLFASTVNLSSRIDGSGSHILALQTRDAASASAVTVTDKVNDSADIIATITYFTNA